MCITLKRTTCVPNNNKQLNWLLSKTYVDARSNSPYMGTERTLQFAMWNGYVHGTTCSGDGRLSNALPKLTGQVANLYGCKMETRRFHG